MNLTTHYNGEKSISYLSFYLFYFSIMVYLFSASIYMDYHTDAALLRLEVVQALIERGDLSISPKVGIIGHDGKAYSWLGLGPVLLALPLYLAAKGIGISPQSGMAVMNQFFGAATVVLVFLYCVSLGYSRKIAFYTSLIYSLGTMNWPYAKYPFDHVTETFFVLLLYYSLCLFIFHKRRKMLLVSGVSAGFAFLTRPTSLLAIPPLVVGYFLVKLKRKKKDTECSWVSAGKNILVFSIMVLPFVALSLWYNHYRFGSISETGYFQYAVRTGVSFFSVTSIKTGLAGLLLSPGKGFFYYTPAAILFFFSFGSFFRRNITQAISFGAVILSYVFFYSTYRFWHGDWAWGPRYLLVITPFMIIPISELFSSDAWLKRRTYRSLVYFIIGLSVIVQIAAVSINFQKYFYHLKTNENVVFQIDVGEGLQPIQEPPPEIYFEWKKSPILAQFRFFYEVTRGIGEYQIDDLNAEASAVDKIKALPLMNLFDMWWVYQYILGNGLISTIGAFTCILLAWYCFVKLWKGMRNASKG